MALPDVGARPEPVGLSDPTVDRRGPSVVERTTRSAARVIARSGTRQVDGRTGKNAPSDAEHVVVHLRGPLVRAGEASPSVIDLHLGEVFDYQEASNGVARFAKLAVCSDEICPIGHHTYPTPRSASRPETSVDALFEVPVPLSAPLLRDAPHVWRFVERGGG